MLLSEKFALWPAQLLRNSLFQPAGMTYLSVCFVSDNVA